VDLTLAPGRILGLLGPSGAGKSTLFGVLSGDLLAAGGQVWLGDRDVTALPLWQRARLGLSYMPQTPSVLHDLTVARNIACFERVAGRPGAAAPWVERLELEPLRDRLAGRLSGGERRRLELVRALVPAPRVLLLDEPFSGLDPRLAQRVGELLREVARGGAALLLADHRLREVLALCDEAALLVDGTLAYRGNPETFLQVEEVEARCFGAAPA
jgi:lipopolysaccharide export system ATP-binding protein